ncbi:MAG TPA: ATP-binding protein [Usitatibacter sp.]|nr:ATP-binding protein [Usitatibacter sp.]
MNITPRDAVEKLLDARLADVLEAMPDAVLVVDSTGRILLRNSQADRLFGYAAGELKGGTMDILVPDRHRAPARAHLDRLFARGRDIEPPFRLELHARRKDATEFAVEMTLAPVETRDGTRVTCTIRDITERQAVEEALNEKNAELEAANKELEAFDYSIAHDLRAPLHRIQGFAAMLEQQEGGKLDAHGHDVLRRITEAGNAMEQLVTDLLALATATRGTLVRSIVDVTALAREIEVTLRRSEVREVEFVLAPGMRARADPGLLRVVIQNLLGNAWKFTRRRAGARVQMDCELTGGEHVFFVRDNGIGFDVAQAEKIFNPFQRLHAAGEFEGTGIGLATVQRIIQRHGGRVWARGSVDEGASFFFTLSRPPQRP